MVIVCKKSSGFNKLSPIISLIDHLHKKIIAIFAIGIWDKRKSSARAARAMMMLVTARRSMICRARADAATARTTNVHANIISRAAITPGSEGWDCRVGSRGCCVYSKGLGIAIQNLILTKTSCSFSWSSFTGSEIFNSSCSCFYENCLSWQLAHNQ